MKKVYGITPLRMCQNEEIRIVKKKFEEIKPLMDKGRIENVYWGNIYLN